MPPELLEGACPFVHRSNALGIGPVKSVPAIAAHANQPHIAQHTQVF